MNNNSGINKKIKKYLYIIYFNFKVLMNNNSGINKK